MAAIISLLIILVISLLVVRIATTALTLTGVSRELARFQARSAFTGVGFTTTEAESIVNHPLRRRIISLCMLLGNVGVVTAVSSLILSFVDVGQGDTAIGRLLLLVLGITAIWGLTFSRWVDRHMERVIEWGLSRFTRLEVKDYVGLMRLSGDYTIRVMQVQEEDWVAEKRLKDLHLMQEGIMVLGINRREGEYVGTPTGDTKLFPEDSLVLYGRDEALDELDERRAGASGDVAHSEAIREQEAEEAKVREQEQRLEAERKQKKKLKTMREEKSEQSDNQSDSEPDENHKS